MNDYKRRYIPPHLRTPLLKWARKQVQAKQPDGFQSSEEEAKALSEFCRKEIPATPNAKQIVELLRKVCHGPEGCRVFQHSEIDKELLKILNKAVLHGNEEAAKMMLDIQDIAEFKASSSQQDEACQCRHFHRARSWAHWKKLCGNEDAHILYDGKTVKLLFVIEEYQNKELLERRSKELGETFWANYDYWEIWFDLRPVGHYYLYVGKTTRRAT